MEVVERLEGTGMTDFYRLSARPATPEYQQMSDAECERKIASLQACWTHFDDVAARVSLELRTGPRGGGRDRDRIIRHTNGAEIEEFAPKVGVVTQPDAWRSPKKLTSHRQAFSAAIREYNGRGASAADLDTAVRDPGAVHTTCWTMRRRWKTGTYRTGPDCMAQSAWYPGRHEHIPQTLAPFKGQRPDRFD
jgi:hypothetical protein